MGELCGIGVDGRMSHLAMTHNDHPLVLTSFGRGEEGVGGGCLGSWGRGSWVALPVGLYILNFIFIFTRSAVSLGTLVQPKVIWVINPR